MKKTQKAAQKEDNIVDMLRLIRSENIGVKTFRDLIKIYGNSAEALKHAPEMSLKGGRKKPIKICEISKAEEEIELSNNLGAKLITYLSPEYPKLMRTTEDYPPIITVLGNVELLNKRTIGVVGSRNASSNGCRLAYKIAQDLGQENIIVASGLARGIDTAAHKGSINTGTIAVVAGGIDNIYPPDNKALREEIISKGAIIAELPFGTIPRGQNFPQRNRIISGISLGTLVVEANMKSGSLITAKMALAQNREVFAVPGFPLDPRCQGTNYLIKEGATLVESIKDILEAISYKRQIKLEEVSNNQFKISNNCLITEPELVEARKEVFKILNASPISIEEVASLCCIPINILLTVIIEMELAGKIERHPGNKISILY